MPTKSESNNSPLERLTRLLPLPESPLIGLHAEDLAMPDSIVSFYHRSASRLNHPPDGRALHHRYVLIFALETSITVCVDDQNILLNAGEGLLILPFQFHNYVQPQKDQITWMFVTFEVKDGKGLEMLRYRVFSLTPMLRQLATDFLRAYMSPKQSNLTTLALALLLERIRQTDLLHRSHVVSNDTPELIIQINRLAQTQGSLPSVKEMSEAIGISASHLRARFRASCGVSLGKHLRRMRMEKACGLLRFGTARISEVAELCGFNSVFSFSRAFSSTYKVSPMEYRQGAYGKAKGARKATEVDEL